MNRQVGPPGPTFNMQVSGSADPAMDRRRSRTSTELIRDSVVAPTQARAAAALNALDREEAVAQHDFTLRALEQRKGQAGVDELERRLRYKAVLYDTAMIEVYGRVARDVKIDPE